MNYEVYMHGQILGTYSFLLKGEFLRPDEYSEIKAKYFLPGGETGTAATVLSSLGVSVKIDGTHIGTEVAPLLKKFYSGRNVDLSSLYFDPDYQGLMDYVVIAGLVRSPMGMFQALYEKGAKKRWNMPKEDDIAGCKAAAIDPFFLEETQIAAELCVKHNKPFVTIDCRHDSYLHQHCAINVVSKECTGSEQYKDKSIEEIYSLLTDNTDGLVIITRGEKEMIYGRKGQQMKKMKPFDADVKSTLGAGDTFKAGCVYGLLHNMSDDETVRFASACSAIAISRFPLPLNPPVLEEVEMLLNEGSIKR
ncbi:MAG: carbohydrate kinase family protein [Oscillospiraceae bacterium]|nr:carbohydrate kinase family protein [Oscillospiraceae bacterium]